METNTETVDTSDSTDVVPEEATTSVEVSTTPPEDKPTGDRQPTDRKSRKAQRLDVEAAERRAKEWEQQLAQERQERQRMDRELAEMRGQLTARQQQAQTQDRTQERQTRIADLRRQAKSQLGLSAQLATAGRTAEADKAWDEYQRLNDEADDVRDEMRDEKRWESRRNELQQNAPNPQAAQALVGHETAFPWLTTNQEAINMADTRLTYLINAGRPFNRQTVIESLAWTAKAMGLGGHSAPSDQQRQRYNGVPGGEGPGNGEGPKTIKMGRHEEAMARAAYPHLEARDAYRQWAKDIAARTAGNPDE